MIGAVVISNCLKQRKTSVLFSTFLLFPPLVVFLNMWAHTTAVSIVNIQRYIAGTFHYSFTLYGLLLFGVAFILLSGFLIHFSRTYIQGHRQQKRKIFLCNLVLAFCFFPVVFITPIGSLPIFAAILSSLILAFWNPYKTKANNTLTTEPKRKSEAAVPAGV